MDRTRCKRSRSVAFAWLAAAIAAPMVFAAERTATLSLDFRSPPAPGQPAALELELAADVPLHAVRIDLLARGAVRILDDPEPAPHALDAGASHRQLVGVWIGDRGRAEVTAVLSGTDAYDLPVTRTVTLYVIVDEAGVGVGTDGFALLERRRLDLLQGRGLVKPADYDRRLRRLLVAAPAY
jgi:hypothetical protein